MRLGGFLVLAALAAFGAEGCAAGSTSESDEAQSNDDELRQSLSGGPSTDVDVFERRTQWIDTYGAVPASCVEAHDARDGTRAVFHGCFDWHSSVHAHWAVYRADLAGSGRRRLLAKGIDRRLDAAGIAKVGEELDADPSFESPYGRAWLLRLASEHETWNAKRAAPETRLRVVGDRVARGLLADFERRRPDPRTADYRSDAWALAQLVAYGQKTAQPAIEEPAKRHIREAFATTPLAWKDTNDHDPSAFMSTYWSSVYAIAMLGDARETIRVVDPAKIPDEALTPLADPGVADDVHHLGINWSRAWAIKALARDARVVLGPTHAVTRRLVSAYHAHVLAGRERHFRYRGNYYAYDHWVPQFAVYAITDGAALPPVQR